MKSNYFYCSNVLILVQLNLKIIWTLSAASSPIYNSINITFI